MWDVSSLSRKSLSSSSSHPSSSGRQRLSTPNVTHMGFGSSSRSLKSMTSPHQWILMVTPRILAQSPAATGYQSQGNQVPFASGLVSTGNMSPAGKPWPLLLQTDGDVSWLQSREPHNSPSSASFGHRTSSQSRADGTRHVLPRVLLIDSKRFGFAKAGVPSQACHPAICPAP
jgi:hypothetical protein